MRMTTKGRYALRASIALARMTAGISPVSIKTIAEAESISPEFLEQIFFKLRKAGLIASVRGPGGGFFFAQPLSTILLKDIVVASGEQFELSPCACSEDDDCKTILRRRHRLEGIHQPHRQVSRQHDARRHPRDPPEPRK